LVDRLAAIVRRAHCAAVICDIAPLGIAVARAAGIPSILIENFTWDDLYEHYGAEYPRLRLHAAILRPWFGAADIRIQTEPVCHPLVGVALTTRPVSRPPRREPADVRRQLTIGPGKKMVLITMGGVSNRTPMVAQLADRDDLVFVVAGRAARPQHSGNVISLPLQSAFYHPDLVHAADVVIGKVGYSTLAEVHRAGVPFGYVCRPNNPEMPALREFIGRNISGQALQAADLDDATAATGIIDRLLALPRRPPTLANGAVEIAEFLARYGV
jgi:UDP:flavonoid glycosyltransferase YjiC (YdhE family)